MADILGLRTKQESKDWKDLQENANYQTGLFGIADIIIDAQNRGLTEVVFDGNPYGPQFVHSDVVSYLDSNPLSYTVVSDTTGLTPAEIAAGKVWIRSVNWAI